MGHRPWFSRGDGIYLNKIDPFVRFFPFIMQKRNESAVYFKKQIDVSALKAYINKKNHEVVSSGQGAKSTMFHAILAAIVKTATERPQVNRFIIGRRIYQRKYLSCAFVIKSEFRDDANEEIAIMRFQPDDTLTSISERIADEVKKIREISKEKNKKRSGAVNWFNYLMHLPRIILRGLVGFLAWIDYHGWLPKFVVDADPMHASIFVSNLGSLHIDAPYHHLYEWGTTSIFMTIGVITKAPVVLPDGTLGIHDAINIALTIDERISDGFYFARTINRFQYLLEHPEELEKSSTPPAKA